MLHSGFKIICTELAVGQWMPKESARRFAIDAQSQGGAIYKSPE